jgi:curved DNA-binding protein CbpA
MVYLFGVVTPLWRLRTRPALAGGSHERMIDVLAAWEILKDPASRAKYNHARTAPVDSASWKEWRTKEQQARSHAQQYPRRWADFQKWRDAVTTDFAEARYGKFEIPSLMLKVPTVAGSWSGALFIWQERRWVAG